MASLQTIFLFEKVLDFVDNLNNSQHSRGWKFEKEENGSRFVNLVSFEISLSFFAEIFSSFHHIFGKIYFPFTCGRSSFSLLYIEFLLSSDMSAFSLLFH